MRRWFVLLLYAACSAFAACGVPPAPTLTPESPYIRLADAPYPDAPALWVGRGGGVAAWVGSDAAGVHIDARTWRADGALSPVVVLPLPPRRPHALSLHPTRPFGDRARVRLLWLDAGDDDLPRLHAAVLSGVGDGDLRVERGPVRVSDRRTLRYAAAGDRAGTLWVVWSGGLASEPGLFVQALDSDGRPQPPALIADDAAWFALTPDADGTLLLFYIAGERVLLARLADGVPLETHTVVNAVSLRATDRLLSLRALQDGGRAYLFWNIERMTDDSTILHETWWTFGAVSGESWQPPARLERFRRVSPLAGSSYMAAESDAGLVLLSLAGGTPTPQRVIAESPWLIGAPILASGADGAVYAAWTSAVTPDVARLWLTSIYPASQTD